MDCFGDSHWPFVPLSEESQFDQLCTVKTPGTANGPVAGSSSSGGGTATPHPLSREISETKFIWSLDTQKQMM